jgi:hypothetical protein
LVDKLIGFDLAEMMDKKIGWMEVHRIRMAIAGCCYLLECGKLG